MNKILFIHEFPSQPDDPMMTDLIRSLTELQPGLRSHYFHGFLKRYRAGGTRPSRVLNMVFMFLCLPIVLAAFRPDLIFVRTSPPCIQLWAALLGWLSNTPVSCWLMDYHPEIEARFLERKGFGGPIAALLRGIDRSFLKRMHSVVVLDKAMAALLDKNAPRVRKIIHPTWSVTNDDLYSPVDVPPVSEGAITLAYVGNLGASHPLETLEALLVELRRSATVRLVGVGLSSASEKRFSEMGSRTSCSVNFLPRTPFDKLGRIFEEQSIQAGIVLLDDATAGLVSPSKYSAYLKYGIPTLYIGPPGTNADTVCTEFAAGFSLRNNCPKADVQNIARSLLSETVIATATQNVESAALFFNSRNGRTLSELLLPLWFNRELPATAKPNELLKH